MGKKELILRNLSEVLTKEDFEKLMKKRYKSVYWGTAPTGKPHAGYFVPLMKIADFLNAGFQVKILFADLHAALDNTPWEKLEKRYSYYKKVIPLMLNSLGVKTNNLEFIKGSSFQFSKKYVEDLFKLLSLTSVRDSNKAASEVVKMGDNPRVSGLIYPLMQALDEEYLGVDSQLGGTDQRKIMVLAREKLPKIGYSARVEFMNPLVPGLVGEKMSASNKKSRIDLLDSADELKKKINGSHCVFGDLNNGVISFLKYVVMVLKEDKKESFVIERPEKYGGNLEYSSYEDLEKDFVSKQIHPMDLKNALSRELDKLLIPIRKHKKEIEKLENQAYS